MRALALFAGWFSALVLLAQSEEDALRYSITEPGGSARGWGLAGAMGAVGADPTSASINPAGFGLYGTSELSVTLGFEVNTADATYYDTHATAAQQRMSMNNLALVLSYPNTPGKNWRGGTFGVSYDRQASYHWKELASGARVNSTMLQSFVNEANHTYYDDLGSFYPFTSFLAWNTYGIDTLPGTDSLYAPGIPFGSDTHQEHSIDASGRLTNTSFFYANNYKDKLYLGISVGLLGVRYERHTNHSETSLDQSLDLESFRYKEDLLTTGNGIDVKIGVLGRVTDRIRLGASFQSPMWLQLNDEFSYEMTTTFQNDGFKEPSVQGAFAYRVNTPWRVVGSALYQAGKHGLVSVDYTYADFRQSHLRANHDLEDEYDFAQENELIHDSFTGTHGLRVGTEWRSGNLYFRGGWSYQQDPYSKDDARHGTTYKQYCGGFGYRNTHLSVDLGIVYGIHDGKYFQYDPDLVEPTSASYTEVRSLITIAVRP